MVDKRGRICGIEVQRTVGYDMYGPPCQCGTPCVVASVPRVAPPTTAARVDSCGEC